jgi:hypothetical protein
VKKTGSRLAKRSYNSGQLIQEVAIMAVIIAGVVKNGVIVPHSPLPEGAAVEIHVSERVLEVPPELQAEFDAWDRASNDSLDLVERLL